MVTLVWGGGEGVLGEESPPPWFLIILKKPWGRGRSGTQKFVYQKWPDQIFPVVNFVFSHDGVFGLEGGGSRGQ